MLSQILAGVFFWDACAKTVPPLPTVTFCLCNYQHTSKSNIANNMGFLLCILLFLFLQGSDCCVWEEVKKIWASVLSTPTYTGSGEKQSAIIKPLH